jgi:hypothetical protein
MSDRRVSWAAVGAVLVIGLSACGGDEGSAVAVRVGDNAITRATVDHWTSVVERRGAFTGFRGEPHGGTPRQRALVLLISSAWLIGEAARQGLPVSKETVDDVLAERMQGERESDFHKRLEATGQTVAGVKLELRAELALEAIREELARRAGQITQPEVAEYYRTNRRLFSTPEARETDIIEGLSSPAAATALVKRVGTGAHFAKLAYHKKVAHTPGVLQGPATKKRVDYAIYAARRGVVSRPLPLDGAWAVFVVRKIIPPRAKPLAKARSEVLASLRVQRKRDLTSAFEHEYRRRWMSKTRCRDKYLIPGCSQFGGRLGAYEDPFLRTSVN